MKSVNVTPQADREPPARTGVPAGDKELRVASGRRVFLRRARRERPVPFELCRPDRKTRKAIADAEKGKDLSGCFDSVDALMEDLEE